MDDIIIVLSEKGAKELLKSGYETGVYEPFGLFIRKEGDKFVGFDNSSGFCWVEEFDTFEECIRWLRGKFDVEDEDS